MNRIANNNVKSSFDTWAVIFVFIFLGILAYGLLIPYLGFYWDDYPLAWIAKTYGGDGLERYFSTNRPYWGLLYQVTTPLLGSSPLHWQLFALTWRIFSALVFWLFLHILWPKKPAVALFAGIAFLLYPGFTQQWISMIYSHFFIVMTAFIASLAFSVKAVRTAYEHGSTNKSSFYAILALCLSFLNLISLEYFFTLELVRYLAIWIVAGEYIPGKRERLRKTLFVSIPYLLLILGVGAWRVFLFPYQTENYQLSILDRFTDGLPQALLLLIQNVTGSIWKTSIQAWLNVFRLPEFEDVGKITVFVSIALVLITFLVIAVVLYILGKRTKTFKGMDRAIILDRSQPLSFGLSALVLAGWPIWLIDLSPELSFSLDRFTLPFMMGSALLLVGILEILPVNFMWKAVIFTTLISLSVGMHFRLANSYRRDWEVQRRFFWQLVWRIPGLKSGTTLLANELPVIHYSDNSLTAPLNWIYAPDHESQSMAFLMVYPARRLGSSLPGLEENLSIEVDYLAATFKGTTSQAVTVFYEPPACLRVLDNDLDALNHMLPLHMQHSAELSDYANIIGGETSMPLGILYPEEAHGWCYYYEKADLARQQRDWATVVELADPAFALGDYPNDPAERLPFIEGFAHSGDWDQSVQQTEISLQVSPRMIPVLCLLWERIARETAHSHEKDEAIDRVFTFMDCKE